MTNWRPHKADGYCDATHCRKQCEQTHVSKARVYALCSDHADAGIADAIHDNVMALTPSNGKREEGV